LSKEELEMPRAVKIDDIKKYLKIAEEISTKSFKRFSIIKREKIGKKTLNIGEVGQIPTSI